MNELRWSIKASFAAYVRGMGDGRIVLEDGASEQDGVFVFRSLNTDSDSDVFGGSVRFEGHNGLLRVEFRHPALVRVGARFAITVADSEAPDGRLEFASVGSLVTTTQGTQGTNITLTAEGSELFFGPYEEGTPFDDFSISASRAR